MVMQDIILSTTKSLKQLKGISACIGYFDGFHIGHQSLFNKTLNYARNHDLQSAIISFDPDPSVVLSPSAKIEHLTSIEDRKQLASDYGFDLWISIEFDHEMAQMPVLDFIQKLKEINIQHLICGYDFKFGRNGLGNTQDLLDNQTSDFSVEVIDAVKYLGEKISTTRIKQALKEGQMKLVEHLLGRSYVLKGTVIKGRQIGRTIGYPTANLKVSDEYIMPKIGVYSGYVIINKLRYSAMIGIGYNPTVTQEHIVSLEAHIFDFNQDIYDLEVEFVLKHYVRSEIKFKSLSELTQQLHLDETQCRQLNANDD
jgi:riboflavin kinase / FMN adenylyltransferase